MTSRIALALALAGALCLGGCRMADGPMPPSEGDVPNRLRDLSADLRNLLGGDADAPNDMADDLLVFVDVAKKPDSVPAVRELVNRVAAGLKGLDVDDAGRERVVRQLWLVVAGRQLSDKQIERVQEDLHSAMLSVKATEQHAQAVASQAVEVQRRVTDRSRRWYELF